MLFRSLKNRLPKSSANETNSTNMINEQKIKSSDFVTSGSIEELSHNELVGIFPDENLEHFGLAQESNAFVVRFDELRGWLETSPAPKVFFDGKSLLRKIANPVPNVVGDVAMMAYLLNPGARAPEVREVIVRYLDKEQVEPVPNQADEFQLDFSAEVETNTFAEIAHDVLKLYPILRKKCEETGLTKVLDSIEIPTLSLLARMEAVGIAVDRNGAQELEEYFAGEAALAAQSAFTSVGREFNLSSPKQLQEILFGELKLPKTKKIKTGYTTDADALNWLMETTKQDRKSTRLNSSHVSESRMPSSA